MRIQVMSDLHLEFHADMGRSFIDALDPTDVDVLVLAGDIGTVASGTLLYGVGLLTEKYPQVVMVAGNHEYYGSTPAQVYKCRDLMHCKLPNFRWLDNNSCEIEGQRFVGTTLWYPVPPKLSLRHMLGDYSAITNFEPWVYEHHAASLEFLNTNVCETDVVVTHMLPQLSLISPRFAHSPLNCFFAVDGVQCTGVPRLWCFGHTHDAIHVKNGRCELVCNPHGYPREGSRFDARKVVHLGEDA